MAYSREIPGFYMTIESAQPFEELPQAELAQMVFNKGLEGLASMVVESYEVREEDVCNWLLQASEIVQERLLKKED
jgi:hypothetical protein